MRATVYVIPGSHPSMAAMLMLERKGIDYSRRDLVAGASRPILRLLGFDGITVPAMRLDGQRLQGTRNISRALDALVPDPPLFPVEPERRAAVEQAEAWGDEVLQPVPRRLVWAALSRDRSGIESFLEGARLGIPTGLATRTSAPVVALAKRLNGATDATARADLERLPALIDTVDELIAVGVIGEPEPNAADYQIAASVRLLMSFDDIRPAVEDRPAGRLARAIVPHFPGRIPAVLPRDWLTGLG
jgi:glutathione S-transferase